MSEKEVTAPNPGREPRVSDIRLQQMLQCNDAPQHWLNYVLDLADARAERDSATARAEQAEAAVLALREVAEPWMHAPLHQGSPAQLKLLAALHDTQAAAAACVARIRREAMEAPVAVLRELEWSYHDDNCHIRDQWKCPTCHCSERLGHAENCALAAAIRDASKREGA